MSNLPRTSQALYELRAGRERSFGSHLGDRVAAGVPGVPIGEVPFDPAIHEISAIDPLSSMELMTDMPHVTQVVPYRPVPMNVVLHQEAADRQVRAPWMLPVVGHKQALASALSASVQGSKQPTDPVNLYVVGGARRDAGTLSNAEVIDGTETPEAAAQAVAEVCMRGLTFVISDFKRLPLHEVRGAHFNNAVGVKANHPIELELPADIGRISLGGLNEVNTNSRRERNKANKELRELNEATEADLARAGLAFASVVFDGASKAGFDVSAADSAIARVVDAVNRR